MAPMKCPSRRQPDDALEESFSLTHLAHRWQMHRRDVRQLLQAGKLPFVQVQRQLRVPRAAVNEFERSDKNHIRSKGE